MLRLKDTIIFTFKLTIILFRQVQSVGLNAEMKMNEVPERYCGYRWL